MEAQSFIMEVTPTSTIFKSGRFKAQGLQQNLKGEGKFSVWFKSRNFLRSKESPGPWDLRKKRRFEWLAQFRGSSNLEDGIYPLVGFKLGSTTNLSPSLSRMDYSGVWAERKQRRFETLARFRGVSFRETQKECGSVKEVTMDMDQPTETQQNVFSRKVISALRQKSHSKDSTGLWARRKEQRFKVLTRFRKMKEVEEEGKGQRMESTDEPEARRKLIIRRPPRNQPSLPHRYPTGVWELRKERWSKTFGHMAVLSVQGERNEGRGKKLKKELPDRLPRRQRNWGSTQEKRFTQHGNVRRHPRYQRVRDQNQTRYNGPNFKRSFQPRQQSVCSHCHACVHGARWDSHPSQPRPGRRTVRHQALSSQRILSQGASRNTSHQSNISSPCTEEKNGQRDRLGAQSQRRKQKRRRSRKSNSQKNYKRQEKRQRTKRSPGSSSERTVKKNEFKSGAPQ